MSFLFGTMLVYCKEGAWQRSPTQCAHLRRLMREPQPPAPLLPCGRTPLLKMMMQ